MVWSGVKLVLQTFRQGAKGPERAEATQGELHNEEEDEDCEEGAESAKSAEEKDEKGGENEDQDFPLSILACWRGLPVWLARYVSHKNEQKGIGLKGRIEKTRQKAQKPRAR